MKLVQVVLVFSSLGYLHGISVEQEAFDDWKQKFDKSYKSTDAEEKAFEIFTHNFNELREHNENFKKGLVSYTLGLWEESDKLASIVSSSLNRIKVPVVKGRSRVLPSAVPKSSIKSLNYVELGWVNEVDRQKKCGSCYTFSACGVIEGQIFKKTGELLSLSKQQLLDCVRDGRNQGCKGGIVSDVFEYIKWNGITTNKIYPYRANDTFPCSYNTSTAVTKIKVHVWPQGIDETYIKNLLINVGPLVVTIDASHQSFILYKSGVYSEYSCTSNVNHAMLLVGFDTDSQFGDYWLIKNSFGKNWGENGYLRLKRGVNMCGVSSYITYALI